MKHIVTKLDLTLLNQDEQEALFSKKKAVKCLFSLKTTDNWDI